jgi:hypothetical protein
MESDPDIISFSQWIVCFSKRKFLVFLNLCHVSKCGKKTGAGKNPLRQQALISATTTRLDKPLYKPHAAIMR